MQVKNKNQNTGFSLVELIVALGLFTVVMFISTSALLSLSDTNRKIQSMRIAFDNINLALGSMSREIRMGMLYYCNPASFPVTLSGGNDCFAGTSIAFLAQDGSTTVYRINGTVIERSKDGGSNFSDMTAPEIDVDRLNFYVSGTDVGGEQSRVVIVVGGTAGVGVTSTFNIQTMVTSRVPE